MSGILDGRQGRATSCPWPTVRISEASHLVLKELAEQTGQTMMDVLDKALDAYRRKLFFERLNAGYAELGPTRKRGPNTWPSGSCGTLP